MSELIERVRANFPPDLLAQRRWLNWRYETVNGKRTKVPYNARGFQKASTTNSDTWSTFDQAAASLVTNDRDGAGYVFAGDGYIGLDFDKCRDKDTGEIAPWAQEKVTRMNSYTEVSPSGTGLHIYVRASLHAPGCKRPFADGAIEAYDRGRYFTVTGQHLPGTPREIRGSQVELDAFMAEFFPQEDTPITAREAQPLDIGDEQLLSIVRSAKNGADFSALYDRGDLSAYDDDQSRADLALCSHLAFYTGWDPSRMDQLFRSSALMRDKWERADYRERTIRRAISATPERYRGRASRTQRVAIPAADLWDEPVSLPDGAPDVVAFDPALMPDTLLPWVRDIAERQQVPLDFPAVGAIVVAGAMVGRQLGIYPRRHDDSWVVVPNLWGAIVGRPSIGKTPPLRECMKPMDRLVAKAEEQYEADLMEFETTKFVAEAMEAARKESMKKAAKEGKSGEVERLAAEMSAKTLPPVKRRYKTNDATVEKLGELLIENPNGLLNFRDELVGWLRAMDKAGHESDRAFWLEAYVGTGGHEVDRIGRGSRHIPALCMSVLGGIQPGPLESYVYDAMNEGGARDDGLLQRFQLIVWPNRPDVYKLVDRAPSVEAKYAAFAVYERLAAIDISAIGPSIVDSDAREIPAIHFSEEAQRMFDEWQTALKNRLLVGDMSAPLEAHLGKQDVLVAKLALLCHLIDSPKDQCGVSLNSTLRAIAWAEYLETHAKRLYAFAENPEITRARALLDRIEAGDVPDDECTQRDVYRKQWTRLRTVEEVADAVQALTAFGWVRLEHRENGNGRPSDVLRIHPQLRRAQRKVA